MKSSHLRLIVLSFLMVLIAGIHIATRADVKNVPPTKEPATQSLPSSKGLIKGIYISQETAENTEMFNSLIKRAKDAGVNTFIVDLELPSEVYARNVSQLKANHITYVARIIMFPDGGTPEQITTESHWKRKYPLMERAISYGAEAIQLDYIRYNTRNGASHEHAKNIYKIISWYKSKLDEQHIPLQVDVFGISSFGEESHIGQNIKMFSQTIDVICPMVYPSHFVPFSEHFKTPYETVYGSLASIKDQFNNNIPVKLVPYIELSNYHYPLSQQKKLAYIYAQIRAAQNAGADGWYAWSPHNQYDTLFRVMKTYPVK